MRISLIVAMGLNRGIGLNGRLPWRLKDDLKHFKQITMGHTLIQGRITWESIGRPLPGRRMVVLTRQEGYIVPEGVVVCSNLKAALAVARDAGDLEAFVGGGAEVFAEALPLADRIYLTRVDAAVEADTFFPSFDESDWAVQALAEYSADERNEFAFRLDLLERRVRPAGAFS